MLGNGAFALANAAAVQSKLRTIGMSMVAELTEVTGETSTLSGRMGHRRVYLGQVESEHLIRISVQVGLSVPLTVGANSHAMLAFLPEDEISDVLNRPVPAVSDRTETRPEAIRARLAEIREAGYARTESERVAESVSFAAPVFDAIGEVTGSISVAALASRVDSSREAELGGLIVDTARRLSERLRS
jgi:IclR family acetate operon transcriptional repressor